MKNKPELHIGIKARQRLLSIGATVAFCLLFLLIFAGAQRGAALYHFFISPLVTRYGWQEMIGRATVYVFVALGVCVMYQCRQFSLISEGSFLAGACATTFFLLGNNTRPDAYLILVGLLLGTLFGALVALIPAMMHARREVNVTLASAITNFFVLEIATFVLQHFMSDPATGGLASFAIPLRMRLPYLSRTLGVRVGTLLALVCVVLAYLVLYRTSRGYAIRTVGASRTLATHVGLSAGSIIVFSQVFAGVMAGLGGAVQMMGISPRYIWNGEFSNIGVAAILVALLADCNPVWVAPSALLFAYFNVGGSLMQQQTGIAGELAGVAQAVLIGTLFVSRYYYRMNKNVFDGFGRDTLKRVHHATVKVVNRAKKEAQKSAPDSTRATHPENAQTQPVELHKEVGQDEVR